ncbi:zf-HC2 domain-containing protein [Streptomyces sp. NPDC051320]|uniref:zf-HC2 domain-containing protein n=1 Tax=Streptomyces sp. NPDC051320 TaxID=3154644 RepID=UPI0034189FF4
MSTYEQQPPPEHESEHDAVAAYALGILDDAEATAFETHLAGCDICAAELDGFAGMEPILASLAEFPGPAPQPVKAPSPQVLGRLVDEVAVQRARRRRRTRYLVAAAAALIIGGPTVAVLATSADSGTGVSARSSSAGAAENDFGRMTKKVSATDPVTKVSATVGTQDKAWGTDAVLELKNVKGPQKCSLIAVSKTGAQETLTTWSVPEWGYGVPDAAHPAAQYPLYVHGGSAFKRSDIDHFLVRTLDGRSLVRVAA